MQTVATREVSFTIDIIIADVDGTIPDAQPKQVESTPSEQGSPRLVRRFFPEFRDVDVIPFCKKQWYKLKKLVDECENMKYYVEALQEYDFEYWQGYPSSIYLVAAYLDENGIKLANRRERFSRRLNRC